MDKYAVETDSLHEYIVRINRIPLLSKDEEFALAKRWWDDKDIEAAKKLVLYNLRFVVKIAFEYRNYGIDIKDLIQEGNIGLLQSVKKFNPYKGYRFISYAVWWIRAYINNFILKSWSLVKIGTTQTQRKLFYQLKKVRNTLEKMENMDEKETIRYLEKSMNADGKDILEFERRITQRDVSLDSPPPMNMNFLPIRFLKSEDKSQEYLIEEQERKAMIKKGLKDAYEVLNQREKFIMKERYLEEKPKTLQEIGDKLGISKERVRQIEEIAKKKMKVVLSNMELYI